MQYRCLNCKNSFDRGILPCASCGLYFIILLGISLSVLQLLVFGFAHMAGFRNVDVMKFLNEWACVIAVPGFVAALLVSAMLNFIAEALEYLAMKWRKCPQCGQRNWSWGFTSGFGL